MNVVKELSYILCQFSTYNKNQRYWNVKDVDNFTSLPRHLFRGEEWERRSLDWEDKKQKGPVRPVSK